MTDLPDSASPDRATSEIWALYRLFLGRDPEDEARNPDAVGGDLADRARTFLRSSEFADRMARAEKGEPLTQNSSDVASSLDLLARLTHAPLPDPLPRTERAILSYALESPALWPEFARNFGERATPLLSTLRADFPAAAEEDWLGYIDFAADWLIRGWVVRRDDPSPVRLGLLVDGKLFARVEASIFRPDVADAYGILGNCGFELRPFLPRSVLHDGATLSLVDLSSGAPLPYRRRLLVSPAPAPPSSLQGELQALVRQVNDLTNRLASFGVPGPVPVTSYQQFRTSYQIPKPPEPTTSAFFSLILPVLAGSDSGLEETLASLQSQDWQNWELVIVPGNGFEVPQSMRTAIASDPRIRLMKTIGLHHLVAARTVGLRAARGSHVIFLSPGIALETVALSWLAYVAGNTGARLIYTDHCTGIPLGAAEHILSKPVVKPAFDHTLLVQRDYISPAVCMEAALARTATVPQDNHSSDILFRAIERLDATGPLHLPLPLFRLPSGLKANADDHRLAATAHLSRLGYPATAIRPTTALNVEDDQLRWPSPIPDARLSIVICTKDRRDLLEPCIASIRRHLARPSSCEIIVMDNRSQDPATLAYLKELSDQDKVRVQHFDEDFNWSRLNNAGAAVSSGGLILFLNNDTEILTPGFDDLIRQHLSQPNAGVLGCLLLYADGTIQHAGTVVGTAGVAAHVGVGASLTDPDLHDWHRVTRQVTAVTGAFLAVSSSCFRDLGGFDESSLGITMNDVDFCMRVKEAGHAVIYTPSITCIHYESASRGNDETSVEKSRRAAKERAVFQQRWSHQLRFDLFHGPGYSLNRAPFSHLVMPTAQGIVDYLERQVSLASATKATRP